MYFRFHGTESSRTEDLPGIDDGDGNNGRFRLLGASEGSALKLADHIVVIRIAALREDQEIFVILSDFTGDLLHNFKALSHIVENKAFAL